MCRRGHELRQGARLAAGRAAERRSVGEGDRLRFLFVRSLHDELLWWRWRASNKDCRYDDAKNVYDFYFHVNLPSSFPFCCVFSKLKTRPLAPFCPGKSFWM